MRGGIKERREGGRKMVWSVRLAGTGGACMVEEKRVEEGKRAERN